MRHAWTLAAVVMLVAFPLASSAASDSNARSGVNVLVKGGVGGFTGDLSNVTTAGPTWGVTVNLQPWSMLGLELGYEGSRNGIADNYVGGSLVRNGGNALLKLSPPFMERVKPFVGGGVGASFLSVTGTSNGLYQSNMMEEVPVAGGIEFNQGVFTAGLRATYRFLVGDKFASTALGNNNPSGGLFDTSLTVGGRF